MNGDEKDKKRDIGNVVGYNIGGPPYTPLDLPKE